MYDPNRLARVLPNVLDEQNGPNDQLKQQQQQKRQWREHQTIAKEDKKDNRKLGKAAPQGGFLSFTSGPSSLVRCKPKGLMVEGRHDVRLTSPGEAPENSRGSPSDLQASDERDTNTEEVFTEMDSRGGKRKHEVSEVAPASPPPLSRCILDSSATDAVTQKDAERVYDGLRRYFKNSRSKSKVQGRAKDGVSPAPRAGGVHRPSGMHRRQVHCLPTTCTKFNESMKTRYGLMDPSGKPVVPQGLRALTPPEAVSVWAKPQRTMPIRAGSSGRQAGGKAEKTSLVGGAGRPMTCPVFTLLRLMSTQKHLGALVGTQDTRNIPGDVLSLVRPDAVKLGSDVRFWTDETVASGSLLDPDCRRLATGEAGTTREGRDTQRMLRHEIGDAVENLPVGVVKGKLHLTKKQRMALRKVGMVLGRLPARALRHAWER